MLTLKENSVQEIEINELIFKEEIGIIMTKIEEYKKILSNSISRCDKTISTVDISSKSVVNNIKNDDFLLNEIQVLRDELKQKDDQIKALKGELSSKSHKINQLETDLKEKVSQYEEKIFFLANEIKNINNVREFIKLENRYSGF